MMPSPIQSQYPWTSVPLIANAAMGGFAGASLATAVSLAGGIGFIGAVNDMEALSTQLESTTSTFEATTIKSPEGTSPLGVGFLLFAGKLEAAVDVISRHNPAIIWLACPREADDFKLWTEAMRSASPRSRIWIQTTTVSSAVALAKSCSPDVLIMQGSDAGGHGPRPGAGVITLVPETRDALDAAGYERIAVFASGGISEGRGVAAALAAGADGVVLGTRFLASQEITLPAQEYQDSILHAKDGGTSTVRGTVFDELKGTSVWPSQYDGRALAGASYTEFEAGVGIEEIREKFASAAAEPHKGFGGDQRAAIWAGSGVGLINKVMSAAAIVEELQDGARQALGLASKNI
ncbi:2-nitropropane dioxygenase [Phlyctema vagabunda]|uniref:2-nitropropane dioxygenase n=1 Tax=Phlyctema vagabunda TaxID=108571 RepID=A0ABR4PTP7_9HELO